MPDADTGFCAHHWDQLSATHQAAIVGAVDDAARSAAIKEASIVFAGTRRLSKAERQAYLRAKINRETLKDGVIDSVRELFAEGSAASPSSVERVRVLLSALDSHIEEWGVL